ncbi:helix-turn-helix transcriptional regulator [Sphingomonas koreensis]|nr:helix-turn-helix transcriptional regulator [Sphingomonas koreensis]
MEPSEPRTALAALIDRSGSSYAALSRLIGRNSAYLQQFVTRGSPRRLAERDRRLLAVYFGVAESALGGDAASSADTAVRVPRLDVAASAGAGALVEDDYAFGEIALDPRLVARLGAKPEALSLISASGRSMEPTIADGDELLIDRGDRRVAKRPAIMVLRLDGGLMVKRVSIVSSGYRIASDNPDFPTIETPEIEVIGRVVWLSRALK